MKSIKIYGYGFLLALVLGTTACNKDPYLPNKPPTYVELVNNVDDYGGNNEDQPLLGKIKLMSYNIHAAVPPSTPGVVNMQAIAAVINAEQPDIVLLQEVDKNTGRNGYNKDQSAELGAMTQMNVAFFSATNVGQGFYGVAILSKYPLSNIRKQLLPKGTAGEEQRVVGFAQVDLPGRDSLVAMVTHLQHNSADSRLLQVKELVNIASAIKLPLLMGGDLNEQPTAAPFFSIFDNSFTRTCITGNCPNTFPSNNANSIIDYLAYRPSNAFSVQSHKVVMETFASDHLPLVSELTINR
ncbi:endonuclease/exonuclease/phosphatase family protein [Flavihumibacter sp. UBA7668]|uniref:endonuclease/exonuclease/phosphatase family protein n=1 Tax=Flavihumibacter sp. UBA7668 TaxID=1946542 RepID=UPI0025BFB418|nr:endonuclease/exonuclease/phosphatase family protein [Flavihumibacter sp. UBA7668]